MEGNDLLLCLFHAVGALVPGSGAVDFRKAAGPESSFDEIRAQAREVLVGWR